MCIDWSAMLGYVSKVMLYIIQSLIRSSSNLILKYLPTLYTV